MTRVRACTSFSVGGDEIIQFFRYQGMGVSTYTPMMWKARETIENRFFYLVSASTQYWARTVDRDIAYSFSSAPIGRRFHRPRRRNLDF